MVTWLKKFSYSIWTKSIVVVLLCICVVLAVQGWVVFIAAPRENSYYETWKFQRIIEEKAGYVRDWIVRYADESIFNPEKITDEEIERYLGGDPVEISRNEEVTREITTETVKTEAIAEIAEYKAMEQLGEKSEAVEEGVQSNPTSFITNKEREYAKKGIIKDRKAYFKTIEKELLEDNANIEFLAIDRRQGRVITNIENVTDNEKAIKDLLARDAYIVGDGASISEVATSYQGKKRYFLKDGIERRYYSYYEGEDFEDQDQYEVYVAVAKELKPGDQIYEESIEFYEDKSFAGVLYQQGLVALGGVIILGIYGLIVLGRKAKDEEVHLTAIDRVPFEVQVIGYGLGLFVCLAGFMEVANNVNFHSLFRDIYSTGYLALMYLSVGAGCAWTLLFLSSCIRHLKNRSFLEHILIIKVIKWILNKGIRENNLPIWAAVGIIVYMSINGILVFIFMTSWGIGPALSLLAWFGFNGLVALGIIKVVIDYCQMAKGLKRIAAGELETKVQLNYALPVMKEMANTINNVGEGLESAVEGKLKSEKLKTELITNVSHDLKTPLTSIISYIDLLKQETIENETANEYIEVLSERSARLKQLVEDLVEASKVATGNVKTDMEKLELSQLVVQAVGEYSDRLQANDLEVIISKLEEMHVMADGRHMWRVIENLLSNVSKYAMPNTRVYVEVRREMGIGKLIIKNISKEPLNMMNPSELTERFVRGDEARTTEGSGLGLAIAQSLVQVQGGQFRIELDGDLFKVEVAMPLN